MTAEEFIAQCRTLLGVRFWHTGRTRQGVDCIGLIILAARECGVEPYDEPDYSKQVNSAHFQRCIERECDIVTDPQPGDILLFNIEGNPQHVGVYVDPKWFIHSWDKIGSVVETRFSKFWQKKVYRIYRWRGW